MEGRGFALPRDPRNDVNRVEWNMPVGARWYPLYENSEDFRLWFENLARGAPTMAIERARVLYRFMARAQYDDSGQDSEYNGFVWESWNSLASRFF